MTTHTLPPEVKVLSWERVNSTNEQWAAASIVGDYRAVERGTTFTLTRRSGDYSMGLGRHATIDEAKAAAQANYTSLILSALEPSGEGVGAELTSDEQRLIRLMRGTALAWESASDTIILANPASSAKTLRGALTIIERLAQPLSGMEGAGITISALQAAHVDRQEEWCPEQKPDLSFRGNELGGEAGEAQNVIKKLERERHGWRGSRDTVEHLAEELADVIHTAILCAITAGIDLDAAVVKKFNDTSEKNGLRSRLSTPVSAASPEGEAGKWDDARINDWMGRHEVRLPNPAYDELRSMLSHAPEGFVLVPAEPIGAMIEAGWSVLNSAKWPTPKSIFAAMLAAAPATQEKNRG